MPHLQIRSSVVKKTKRTKSIARVILFDNIQFILVSGLPQFDAPMGGWTTTVLILANISNFSRLGILFVSAYYAWLL